MTKHESQMTKEEPDLVGQTFLSAQRSRQECLLHQNQAKCFLVGQTFLSASASRSRQECLLHQNNPKVVSLRHSELGIRHSFVIGGSLVGHSSFTELVGHSSFAILSGSFNPLHHGHIDLAATSARRLGVPVHFELSIANADKPELPDDEVERRAAQFAGVGPLWITRAPTFEMKAELFPGVAFVLGWDTAVRVIDPKYYGGVDGRDAAMRKLLDCGCRFVVAGRVDATGAFRVWDSGEFTSLFVPLTEDDFRVDVSSTQLRNAK